jgi:hypothetical protein
LLFIGAGGIIVGFFLKFIPVINRYQLPIQLISIAVFCTGLYWYGGYSTEMLWRDKVAALENQVAESEQQSKKTNTVIKHVYRDRVKIVKQDVVVVQEKIKEIEKLIDQDCRVAPEAINLLNEAARTRRATADVGTLSKDEKQ